MKFKRHYIQKASYTGLACLLIFILKSCAIPMAPTGGPKDMEPPKISKTSPENFSKNQNIKQIELSFNEYIELNNPQQEIIITPALKENPEFSVLRKTIEIDFKENKLQENTTYSIQFGNAIKDITEGNILKDVNYVFSTGSYIDSLFVSGSAVNASDGNILKGVKIMLYRQITDSAIYKKKPAYFTRTGDDGKFVIKNLPKDSFYIYAINDKNENYLLDGNEEIAFLPERIKTDTTLSGKDLMLQLYMPESNIAEIKRTSFTPPSFNIRFAKKADSLSVVQVKNNKELPLRYLKISAEKDSIIGWIPELADTTGIKIRTYLDKVILDTVLSQEKGIKVSIRPNFTVESSADIFNKYGYPTILNFSIPVSRVTKEKILLFKDSIPLKITEAKFTDSSKIIGLLNWNYETGKSYRLLILPGAIRTIYGSTNDSMEALANFPDRKNYGLVGINITVDNLAQYIFQMVNENGKIIFDKIINKSQDITIPYVESGNYKLRLIEDKNKNGRWDPGSITSEKQPEKMYYQPEELRVKANWEMTDIKFDLTKIKKLL